MMTGEGAGEAGRQNGGPAAERPAGGPAGRADRAVRHPARRLDFDVVIATRNRPEALALSIPLILGQSRRPQRLVVVDSSDEHASVAETVAAAVAATGWDGAVIVEHTGPGSAYQRNLGLAHVEAEVVIFPDDDSLFHPGTSEAIMRAYELDTENRIAGVCAADALDPPPGVLPAARYDMTPGQKRGARIMGLRNRLERRFAALNPTLYLGEILMARATPLDWFAAENCVLVESMTGYRMSFRTAVIRANPFDETLKDYALHEDLDASFAAMRQGALVGARNARVYHHRFPSARGDAYTLGLTVVMNRAYVALKHVHDAGLAPAEAARTRALVRQFCRLKLMQTLPRIYRRQDREHLQGVLAGLAGVRAMLQAPRAELPRLYSETMARARAHGRASRAGEAP
jgi:glycosyltransferase involved in cell wall biosynthesis